MHMNRARLAQVVAMAGWVAGAGCFPEVGYAPSAGDGAVNDAIFEGTDAHDDTIGNDDGEAGALVEDMVRINPAGQSFTLVPQPVFEPSLSPVELSLNAAFDIDRYEVTTGRFKAWVNAGRPLPSDGALLDEGGPYASTMVWQSAWTVAYEAEKSHPLDNCYSPIEVDPPPATWAASSITDDWTYPMTCVTWFDAVAFCHSEGKRLPTQAEWVYTARGGPAHRTYPWGELPPSGCAQSTFNPDGSFCDWPRPAGSASDDESPVGVRDMGGSVFEWIWDVDWTKGTLPPSASDYAGPEDVIEAGGGSKRMRKGGAYVYPLVTDDTRMAIDVFDRYPPTDYYADAGFRCVRSVTR